MTRRLIVEVGSDQLRAEVVRGTRVEWEAVIPAGGIDDLEAQLSQLRGSANGQALPRRLLVRLTAPLLQRRTLTDLPPVRHRELARLVAHNAARFFRQNGHPLVTDGAWEGLRGGTAQAVAVEDQVVERVLQAANAAGFHLDDIEPLHSEGRRLSLLPPSERVRRDRVAWRKTALIAGMAGLAWLLAIGMVTARLAWQNRALSRELASLEAPRQALNRVRREAGDAAEMIQALSIAEAVRGALASELAGVVAALPKNGALQKLSLDRQGMGEIAGTAPSAVALLAKLSEADAIRSPALAAPSVSEAGPGGAVERYAIRIGNGVAP